MTNEESLTALVFRCGNGRVDRVAMHYESGVIRVVVVGEKRALDQRELDRLDREMLRSGQLPSWRILLSSVSAREARRVPVDDERDLLAVAGLHPCEVLDNPMLDVLSLADPAMWQRIRLRAGLTPAARATTRARSYGVPVDSVILSESEYGWSARARYRVGREMTESMSFGRGPTDARWVRDTAIWAAYECRRWTQIQSERSRGVR